MSYPRESKLEFINQNYTKMNYKTLEIERHGMSVEVGYDSVANYGYFECYDIESGGEDYHAEGGLWTDRRDSLQDYDGVFELSPMVIELGEELGINMDYAK